MEIVWLKPQRVRLPPLAAMYRRRSRPASLLPSRHRRWRQRIFWALTAAFVVVLLGAWYLAQRKTGGAEANFHLEKGSPVHDIFRDIPLKR